MSTKKEKVKEQICPLVSHDDSKCAKNECAWYWQYEGCCAVLGIVKYLNIMCPK